MVTVIKDGVCYIVSKDKVAQYLAEGYVVLKAPKTKAKKK